MDEVIRAPLSAEAVLLPLLEDVEQGEVIALGDEEFFPRRVRFLLSILRKKTKTKNRRKKTRMRTVKSTVNLENEKYRGLKKQGGRRKNKEKIKNKKTFFF